MNKHINKVAVIGSGIMGSGIACHFANIGVEVLLLDIVPRELNEKEKAKGLTLNDKVVRNRLVNDSLTAALKSKPSPIYHQKFASRITTGNLEDDIAKVSKVDWIIEVVVERLDIKKQVFENLEKHRTPGTLITSNTSGTETLSGLTRGSDNTTAAAHSDGATVKNASDYTKWGASQTGDIITAPGVWTLDNFGNKLIATIVDGATFEWDSDATGATSTRATIVANAPTAATQTLVSTPDRHLVFFGTTQSKRVKP